MLTQSTPFPLGSSAPDFSLPDTVSGDIISLNSLRGTCATVIMFICNHCPYVIHIAKALPLLAQDYKDKGVGFAAISANDASSYPEDGPDNMSKVAKQYGYPFPYLYDESQQTAKAYHAACTPDFYIFDKQLACVYHGRLDEATPGNNKPVTGHDIRAALESLIADKPITFEQKPSLGCSIKWRDA